MAIEYGVEHLRLAVEALVGDGPPQERLQCAWDDHVQLLWTSVYLPEHLNDRFKAMWARYTAPSDDALSTVLRKMSADELARAASDVVTLAFDTIAAHARGEQAAPPPRR